jgi:hypothetical protein
MTVPPDKSFAAKGAHDEMIHPSQLMLGGSVGNCLAALADDFSALLRSE